MLDRLGNFAKQLAKYVDLAKQQQQQTHQTNHAIHLLTLKTLVTPDVTQDETMKYKIQRRKIHQRRKIKKIVNPEQRRNGLVIVYRRTATTAPRLQSNKKMKRVFQKRQVKIGPAESVLGLLLFHLLNQKTAALEHLEMVTMVA